MAPAIWPLLLPAAYSAAVAASQVISASIPLGVLETSLYRTAAVGAACIAYLAAAPPAARRPSAGVLALSVLSGVIMFFAAAAYIGMCRCSGVVATNVVTTAFSFAFAALSGAYLRERVPATTYAAMALVLAGVALHACGAAAPPPPAPPPPA